MRDGREARASRPHGAHWIARALLGAMAAALLGALAVGACAHHEGYRLYAVRTGSMSPGLPSGTLLVDAPPTGPFERGDVVTVARAQGPDAVVTHRVVDVDRSGALTMKGDANRRPDAGTVAPGEVVGEVIASVPRGGYVLVYLSQPTGAASLIGGCLLVALAWSLFFGEPATPARR
ncbi:signal peptidase I [Nocardioides sp. YIM 152588]|uniref:signal peptidase I n=1 Tax=Nocardioides sp. YIM 152588 TaxID=3158259 RepID=UPI0032E42E21